MLVWLEEQEADINLLHLVRWFFAINNYWNLKVLDSIIMSADKIHLPTEEYQTIIDKLIGNDEVKTMLVRKPDL
jgi:hypothetical protein